MRESPVQQRSMIGQVPDCSQVLSSQHSLRACQVGHTCSVTRTLLLAADHQPFPPSLSHARTCT